jgi:TolB-like protein
MGRAATPARVIKLAVLPFANLSGDAEQDHLSDGLTQEMTALLGSVDPDTLRVVANTSVKR